MHLYITRESSSSHYIRLLERHPHWPRTWPRNIPTSCSDHISTWVNHPWSMFGVKLSLPDIFANWNQCQNDVSTRHWHLLRFVFDSCLKLPPDLPRLKDCFRLISRVSGHQENNKAIADVVVTTSLHGIYPKWKHEQSGYSPRNIHF